MLAKALMNLDDKILSPSMIDSLDAICPTDEEIKLLSEYNYALEFYANGALSRVIIVQKLKPQAFTVLGWNANDIALAQASSLALCIVCLFLAHVLS